MGRVILKEKIVRIPHKTNTLSAWRILKCKKSCRYIPSVPHCCHYPDRRPQNVSLFQGNVSSLGHCSRCLCSPLMAMWFQVTQKPLQRVPGLARVSTPRLPLSAPEENTAAQRSPVLSDTSSQHNDSMELTHKWHNHLLPFGTLKFLWQNVTEQQY